MRITKVLINGSRIDETEMKVDGNDRPVLVYQPLTTHGDEFVQS